MRSHGSCSARSISRARAASVCSGFSRTRRFTTRCGEIVAALARWLMANPRRGNLSARGSARGAERLESWIARPSRAVRGAVGGGSTAQFEATLQREKSSADEAVVQGGVGRSRPQALQRLRAGRRDHAVYGIQAEFHPRSLQDAARRDSLEVAGVIGAVRRGASDNSVRGVRIRLGREASASPWRTCRRFAARIGLGPNRLDHHVR